MAFSGTSFPSTFCCFSNLFLYSSSSGTITIALLEKPSKGCILRRLADAYTFVYHGREQIRWFNILLLMSSLPWRHGPTLGKIFLFHNISTHLCHTYNTAMKICNSPTEGRLVRTGCQSIVYLPISLPENDWEHDLHVWHHSVYSNTDKV